MIAVGSEVWSETLGQVRRCGAGRRECVVFWVGSAEATGVITRMVHPKHTATPWHYRVDDAWLNGFWLGLARSHESVKAQVHTHGSRASHSRTDDMGALVYQEGFLSLVVPRFAMQDDCRDRAFLAELDASGQWREVEVGERFTWA